MTSTPPADTDPPPARIVSINRSPGGIPKHPVPEIDVTRAGLRGDGHNHDKHNTPLQAVSLIDLDDLDDLREEGFDVYPGATGENVTLEGLDIDAASPGDRLRFAGGVELELSRRRNPCYVLDAISPALKTAIRGRCGFYARVVTPGRLRRGEPVRLLTPVATPS